MILDIRRFVSGVDEPVWVQVLNASRKDRDDWRAMTAEELRLHEKEDPSFDPEGRFIAELDGGPVGVVHANVDKLREERMGFIRFDVIPESRSTGIPRQLVETALKELRARGMTTSQAFADARERDYIELLEGLDFKNIRVGSMMEMDLANVPDNIGENTQVIIRPLQKHQEEEIRLLTQLWNETFKDHFNFRPGTLEEARQYLLTDLFYREKEIFFAMLDGESVGYIGVGIDEKYNLEKNVKAGVIFMIGVLEKCRQRGIGARLMLHGLQTLKAKGMTRALLGVDNYNPTKAMKLYQKIGFTVKKQSLTFERQL